MKMILIITVLLCFVEYYIITVYLSDLFICMHSCLLIISKWYLNIRSKKNGLVCAETEMKKTDETVVIGHDSETHKMITLLRS